VLTGVPVRDRASARKAAQALLERGVGAMAIQAGDGGNLLVWRGGERLLSKVPVKSVVATGAGDSFAAALATTKLDAQAALPRREEVLALMARGEQEGWMEDRDRTGDD
jgi:ribokinase